MKILAADDEALALEMLVDSIREVKLDAGAVNSYYERIYVAVLLGRVYLVK